MSGFDDNDSTSLASPPLSTAVRVSGAADSGAGGVRVGIPAEYAISELTPAANNVWRRAAALLQSAGATVDAVSLPHTRHGL